MIDIYIYTHYTTILYVYVHIYNVHVCNIYIYVCVYMHIYIHTIYTYMYTYIYIHMYVYVYIYIYTNTHGYIIYVCVSVCIYILYTYMYTFTLHVFILSGNQQQGESEDQVMTYSSHWDLTVIPWMQTFQHRPPSWHWFPPNRHFAPGSVGYHYIYKLLGISWVTTLIPNLFSRSGGMTGLPCPWLRLIHSWCLPPKLETSSANRTSHVPGLSESLGAFCSATVHAAATDSSPREFGSRPTVCELEAMVHLVRWFTYSKWWCSSSQTATNNQRLRTRCLVSQASCISCISYIKLIISSYIRLYLIHSSTIFPWYSNRLVLPHHHQPLRLLSRAFQNSISSSGPLFSPSLAESSGGLCPNGEWLWMAGRPQKNLQRTIFL